LVPHDVVKKKGSAHEVSPWKYLCTSLWQCLPDA